MTRACFSGAKQCPAVHGDEFITRLAYTVLLPVTEERQTLDQEERAPRWTLSFLLEDTQLRTMEPNCGATLVVGNWLAIIR